VPGGIASAHQPVLAILATGAAMNRGRSQSRVCACAASDAEAAGRSALDGDLDRLKAGTPGGWPFRLGAVGGRDGGQPVTGGARVTHGRSPAVCRRCKGGSGQPGDVRRPRALAPAPPGVVACQLAARALPCAGARAARRRRAPRAFKDARDIYHRFPAATRRPPGGLPSRIKWGQASRLIPVRLRLTADTAASPDGRRVHQATSRVVRVHC
jgi:hypothetical protein